MLNGAYINNWQVDGFEAEDEEAYQLWLRDPSAAVGHIVHLYYNGTSAAYPNWVLYILKLSNFPVAGHHDVIHSLPSFTRAISADLQGEVSTSIGSLVLDNTDGALDRWHELSMDGHFVRIYHGDPTWPVSRFRLLCECLNDGVSTASSDQQTVRLRGIEHEANEPIQTALIPNTTFSTANSNRPVPKAFGTVFNIMPPTIDEANETRQWNDAAVTAVTAGRDSGYPFNTDPIAISAVNTGTDVISTATAHGFVKDTRVRCDLGSLPSPSNWSHMVWNGQVFCTVAFNTNICATSPDGITWTLGAMPLTADWHSLGWNGSLFVCLAYQSAVSATSPDGLNWTARSMPVSAAWTGITWNGSVFVVLCGVSANVCYTSPDGIAWTSRSMPATTSWWAVEWNGSRFVALPLAGTVGAYSTDGATWNASTIPTGNWRALAYGAGRFVACSMGTREVMTSPDGITWTLYAVALPSTALWYTMEWNGTVFCVVAQSASASATSPDGITWTAGTMPALAAWRTIAWNGYRFCVVAQLQSYSVTSADGVTWTGVVNTLPAPLAVNTDYWAMADALTATDFKVAASRGSETPVNLTVGTTGALLVGYHWTPDLTNGKVYLDSKPAGDFTMDGTAGTTAPASILQTVLNATNVDSASLAKFAVTCAQPVGLYVGERKNRLDLAKDLMSGLGAWYGYSRHTLLRAGRIEGTPTEHDFLLIEDDMDEGSFQIDRMILPAKQHRIGYRRNWTNQEGKLVAGVSAEARALYSTDYSISPAALGLDEGADGSSFHRMATKPDMKPSLMVYGFDAQTEALRRNTMFYGWGVVFRATIGKVGAEMNPGQVCKVTHSRFNCSAGVRMTLVHVEDQPTNRATVIKLFVALAIPYIPGQL